MQRVLRDREPGGRRRAQHVVQQAGRLGNREAEAEDFIEIRAEEIEDRLFAQLLAGQQREDQLRHRVLEFGAADRENFFVGADEEIGGEAGSVVGVDAG